MEERLADLTFEQWIHHVFDHEVREPAWYFDLDADFWDGSPTLTIEYMTRLFNKPRAALESYTDAQLKQGLWYIAHTACSHMMLALTDASVAMNYRIACVRAMFPLFRDLFAIRCSPHLGHLSEAENPLNLICYMWWDLIPLSPEPQSKRRVEFDAAVLEVMQKILASPSPACQEAALHGLGHWATGYPRQVDAIIAHYLKQNPKLRPELSKYAQAARTGRVM